MKAKVFIKQTKRGYYIEVDNGYGNTLMITDILSTIEDAEAALKEFQFAVIEALVVESP